ncbi:O-acetyl-ADP-ribose deacetylase [Mucilaginibacter lutimaris]|uniref:O-acetyl-ADP-ribose deacetylase n=1 Tax=Mucilaginibacter lutimaris TaxID=931629 RepID=A0ABW2ZCX6_9SPHI
MDKRVTLQQGDITKLQVDAIVNAANSSLMGGGGVDGAIHRAGGKEILNECIKIVNRQGGCKTGEAVITTGGNLPAKYVIHTVGPVWGGGNRKEEQLLANCYINSLKIAVNNNAQTIAFPNISTGVYRFPKDKAAAIAVKTVHEYLQNNATISEVIFICFDDENYNLYKALLGL